MHKAYEIHNVLKIPSQIESLAAYDNKLLIGTKEGHLLMYSVEPKYDNKFEVQFLRYNKKFGKKPVQQLAMIPEHDVLIRLSDNIITLHDLSGVDFPQLKVMSKTKGASFFTLDIKRHVSLTGDDAVTVRMCVAVKRRLQLYYLKRRDFLDFRPDIVLSDTPKAVAWAQETLAVGFKGSYILVQLKKETEETELFPTGKHLEPSVTRIAEDMFALSKDTQSVFVNTQGESTFTITAKWSDIPTAIGFDEPYLVAVVKDWVEVRCWDVEPNTEIQRVSLGAARLVTRASQGVLYLASGEQIHRLQAVPVHAQLKPLLNQKRFELALKLANISDDTEEEKKDNISKIQTLFAFDLFENKKFGKAMNEFLKLETDPYEVIRLFPTLLPKQEGATPVTRLEDKELENGIVALITYLTEVRAKLKHQNKTEAESKTAQQLMQIIDTTLLKCYLQTNDALVAPLLRRNYCSLDEAERTLKAYNKLSELIILYQTKGLHKKALELLQSQASVPESPLRGHDRTIHYLHSLGKDEIDVMFEFAGWVLEAQPEDGLRIFTEDIPEVEQLPRPKVLDFLLRTHNHNLVIPYLEHVIHVWKETNSIFHNALVHEYRERVKAQGPDAATMRSKLVAFLDKSQHYTPEAVLIHFPSDSMLEERALINSRLGRHEHALSIYATLMGDYKKALEYCDQVYTQSGGDGSVYVSLIRLLVSPPDTVPGVSLKAERSPDLAMALELVEGHAHRVPVLAALSELPDHVSLSSVSHFLSSGLHVLLDQRRTTQLLKGLLYAQHLHVQEQRMELESKNVLINECNICPVCKKRFMNQSAFVRYPNGSIVHYSCQDKMT